MADHLTPDPIPPDEAQNETEGASSDPDADRTDEELGADPGERGVPGGREAQADDDA
jgi:hypothetical protein